ncbi:hypothetical protein CEXT_182341 [Caerostris extrusa]|uniref:Uncharacterized protein n=1 Tax=Caerostris extrusa TaxID=172846 RepID=A0AAV4MSQ6_CAEEX|nr:hypothetical protein CEXT_182341 [Caerostris extrusa]
MVQFGTISKDGESTDVVVKNLPDDLISVPWRVDGRFTFHVLEFKGFVMSVDVGSEVVELTLSRFQDPSKQGINKENFSEEPIHEEASVRGNLFELANLSTLHDFNDFKDIKIEQNHPRDRLNFQWNFRIDKSG